MARIPYSILIAVALAATAPLALAAQTQAAAPASTTKAKAAVKADAKIDAHGKQAPADTLAVAEPAKPIAKLVQYPELETRVGDTVIVETTFDTVRRGKLIKYTNVGITLQLGPENGSIELDIPRETVRNVSVAAKTAEEQPAAAKQDAGSAKKN
ncbi:hypothetical protein [Dokdonella sp.]|uniref:hypothetical protein n=1 Tax=Dokdonella sp. TaxID=2291710 RepID=UPI0025C3D5C6|nr:hypothetical protein [Dokdonella sp.]MBX3689922.1 hypothetical protein [Dokdonella sp.]